MRAWILLAIVCAAGLHLYLWTSDRGALLWVNTASEQSNSICTYYTPVRLFQLKSPLGRPCELSHGVT